MRNWVNLLRTPRPADFGGNSMYFWIIARIVSVFVILAVLSGHKSLTQLALYVEGSVALSISIAVLVAEKSLARLTTSDWQRVAKARLRQARWIQAEHLSTAVLGGAVVALLAFKGYYSIAALSLLSLGLLAWFYRKMEAALRKHVG